MEKLIFLGVVVVISIISSWWKKRQEEAEAPAETDPWPVQQPGRPSRTPGGQSQVPSPSKAANWEEELRRLLEGEEVQRPAARPVILAPSPMVPPPLPVPFMRRSAPVPPPVVVSQSDPDMDIGLPVQMPTLADSAQAFLRASNIEAKVAAHMQRTDQQVASHPKFVLKREASPEVRQAVSLVRNRQSQRAVILAGIILGPPKAMEA